MRDLIKPRRASDWLMLGVVVGLYLLAIVHGITGNWADAANSAVLATAFAMLRVMGHLLDDQVETTHDVTYMLVNAHDQMVAAKKWHDEVCDCGAFGDHIAEHFVPSMPPDSKVTSVRARRT